MGYRRYSIYRIKDDFPLAIFQPAQECARILGVSLDTFRSYFSRQRNGIYMRGVHIYRDDTSDMEEYEDAYKTPHKNNNVLKPIAYCIIQLKMDGLSPKQIANVLNLHRSTICYHESKIMSFYGYAPWEQWNTETLLLEEAKSIGKKTVGK